MADDFYATAKRMHKSSKTLHDNSEYHNACYLAGYVVECYAKIVVQTYSTTSPRSFRHDINRLSTELNNLLQGNSSLSHYVLDGPNDFSNILSQWNPVSMRYRPNANIISNLNISTNFQGEIQLAMQKLAQMELDGII
jgi:hypothetical protein